jgi:hypothetical protein
MRKPEPRVNPGRAMPVDPIAALARRIAETPRESLVATVEKALREAHRAGAAEAAANLSGAERDLAADLAAACETGELRLVQPLGPCPGLPWQIEASGRAVLDAGGFAAAFPDAAVRGLIDKEVLMPAGDAVLAPGPRFAEVVQPGAASPSP